jgi:sugar phosphate isomerase/epimerase
MQMPKLGLQLYTLRDLAQEDFVGTLAKVAEIGYEGIEFAGYGGLSAKEIHKVIEDLGLTPVSNHVEFAELENNLDFVIEDAAVLGLSYIVCPYVPQERRTNAEDYQKLAKLFSEIGAKCAQAGLKFAYHNHAFEFKKFGDLYALDCLYNWTDAKLVQAELDIYWIEFAGESASKYIERYQDRCELLHVKDMTDDSERYFTEVGSGCLDIPSILSTAQKGNVEWFLVEQDVCRRDPVESVTMSFRYLSQVRVK